MQALDDLRRHEGRAGTELGASQVMRLRDHGSTDLSHQPARGQLGRIGPHRLQMRVLERGEGDVLCHAMRTHQVYRALGQVRRMPFEFDMEVRSSLIARQYISKGGNASSCEGFPKPGTGVKRLECGKCLTGHWTRTARGAVHRVVMDHDEVVVVSQVHVEFQMGGSHLERQVKGRYSVLRSIG